MSDPTAKNRSADMLHHDPLEAVLDSLFYDLPLMREAVHDLYPADADDLEEPF